LEADPKDRRKAVQASSEEAASPINFIIYQKLQAGGLEFFIKDSNDQQFFHLKSSYFNNIIDFNASQSGVARMKSAPQMRA
jgi:hypothetical protein